MAPIQQFRILAPSTPLTNPITLSVSAEPSFRRSGPKRAVRSTAGLQSGNPRLGWLNDLHSNGGRQDGRSRTPARPHVPGTLSSRKRRWRHNAAGAVFTGVSDADGTVMVFGVGAGPCDTMEHWERDIPTDGEPITPRDGLNLGLS